VDCAADCLEIVSLLMKSVVKSTAWHLITSEYPPQIGGVSDYTYLVAGGLAATGDEVHVWCPQSTQETPSLQGVTVHRELGQFHGNDLRHAGEMLNQFPSPRHLLVQWVPHGYGYNSMNFQFCLWLWKRAAHARDRIDLMVHEPCLPFGKGSLKQNGVAAVHRLMTIVLLNAARHVWMSIPAWATRLRPYSLGRALPFTWLPVTSNIAVVDDPDAVRIIRARYVPDGQHLLGHFGTYDRNITELLLQYLPLFLLARADRVVLLLGRGSEAMRERLLREQPDVAERVHATGTLAATDLSLHLKACDLMLQPYIDGVSSRRTSVMVALSHGLPIVTTSGRLTESLWTESGAVAIAPVGDTLGIVNLIERLLQDPTERARLGNTARALYQEKFDLRHTIEALQDAKRNDREQCV